MNIIILLSLISSVIISKYPCNARLNEQDISRLKREMLKDYNNLKSPVNETSQLNVRTYFFLSSAKVVYQDVGLTLRGWIAQSWEDRRLRWNPSDYGNVTQIRLNVDSVWKPVLAHVDKIKSTIIIKNNLNFDGLLSSIYTDYNGKIFANAKIALFSEEDVCEDDFKNWPRDNKVCSVSLSYPLSLNGNTSVSTKLQVHYGLEAVKSINRNWDVTNTSTVQKLNSETNEKEIILFLYLQRRTTSLGTYVIAPIFVIHMIALLLFWLQPTNSERVILEGLIITCHVESILLVSFMLPHVGDEIPYIVTILAISLFLIISHFLITIISRRLYVSTTNPPWLSAVASWALKNPVISWIFFYNVNDKVAAEILEEDEEGSLLIMHSKKQQKQLQILSHLLNFTAFILSIPISIILLLGTIKYS